MMQVRRIFRVVTVVRVMFILLGFLSSSSVAFDGAHRQQFQASRDVELEGSTSYPSTVDVFPDPSDSVGSGGEDKSRSSSVDGKIQNARSANHNVAAPSTKQSGSTNQVTVSRIPIQSVNLLHIFFGILNSNQIVCYP